MANFRFTGIIPVCRAVVKPGGNFSIWLVHMMNEDKKPKRRFSYVRPLAGLYLLYLAYQLVRDITDSTTDYPAVAVVGAVVFAAVGAFLLWQEWKIYRYDLAHKDDPSTWSDDPTAWAGAAEPSEEDEASEDGPEDGGEDET